MNSKVERGVNCAIFMEVVLQYIKYKYIKYFFQDVFSIEMRNFRCFTSKKMGAVSFQRVSWTIRDQPRDNLHKQEKSLILMHFYFLERQEQD